MTFHSNAFLIKHFIFLRFSAQGTHGLLSGRIWHVKVATKFSRSGISSQRFF